MRLLRFANAVLGGGQIHQRQTRQGLQQRVQVEHLAAFAPRAIEHDQTQLRQLSGLHPQRRQGGGARAVAAADRGHWVDTAKRCAYRRQPTAAPAGPGQSTPPLRVGCLAGANAAAGRCFWRGRAPRGAARSATSTPQATGCTKGQKQWLQGRRQRGQLKRFFIAASACHIRVKASFNLYFEQGARLALCLRPIFPGSRVTEFPSSP